MNLSNIDLFASQFQFYVNDQHKKKGTLYGFILSLVVIAGSLTYFIYIITQYITNQIEPTFRSQNFIVDTNLQYPLRNDLVAFKFDYGNNIEPLQNQDKTYFVFYAFYYFQNQEDHQFIPLDVIDCQNSNLIGFKCIDFSKLSNNMLTLDNNENIQSQVQILTYGCLDIDSIKTTIPDNCATQTEIDNAVNAVNAGQRVKLFTSQYNITSQNMQVYYKNIMIFTYSDYSMSTIINTQLQTTSVKQGLIFQSEQNFIQPIQYSQINQSISRQSALQSGDGAYSFVTLQIDESVEKIYIQYTTLPQILALVNSIFAFLMFFGFIGRKSSEFSIKKDLIMLYFQSLFQDNYLEILKANNLLNHNKERNASLNKQKSSICDNFYKTGNIQATKDNFSERYIYLQENSSTPISVPVFINKKKNSLDIEQFTQSPYKKSENTTNSPSNSNFEFKIFSPQKRNSLSSSSNSDKLSYNLNQRFKVNTKLDFYFHKRYNKQQSIQNQQQSILNAIKSSNSNSNLQLKAKIGENSHKSVDFEVLQQKLQNIQSLSLSEKLKRIIFNQNYCSKKQSDQKKLSNKAVELVEKQVRKNLNIINFLNDILLLKKAIAMILNKQQLAALQHLSYSENYLQLDMNNVDIKQIKDQNLTHFEAQSVLLENQEVQQYFMNKFLQRCMDENNSLTKIDKRIYKSFKKSYFD
ncbi:AMP-binding enzyme family protein (macronuclear) [Tetrahymena thermophila SB210]|uniref:AMP-binding enzyme family protein n=1 Tax=Tetrahymena thermophila (strain SB210) TaxID=312017 RepID=W7XBS8_TETTS|nr:AMP-binding enzyme family protein [Tetrahymena thermophila SB210]EWS74787.1 AMP-binding enzyme family protein [Tetrahymena thermophila SB210]|eukprot:XP_012652680.1 AMP-binding enzyme family protein [Tetrahymena thermophila SB210]